jgi:hypothetical protein
MHHLTVVAAATAGASHSKVCWAVLQPNQLCLCFEQQTVQAATAYGCSVLQQARQSLLLS